MRPASALAVAVVTAALALPTAAHAADGTDASITVDGPAAPGQAVLLGITCSDPAATGYTYAWLGLSPQGGAGTTTGSKTVLYDTGDGVRHVTPVKVQALVPATEVVGNYGIVYLVCLGVDGENATSAQFRYATPVAQSPVSVPVVVTGGPIAPSPAYDLQSSVAAAAALYPPIPAYTQGRRSQEIALVLGGGIVLGLVGLGAAFARRNR